MQREGQEEGDRAARGRCMDVDGALCGNQADTVLEGRGSLRAYRIRILRRSQQPFHRDASDHHGRTRGLPVGNRREINFSSSRTVTVLVFIAGGG